MASPSTARIRERHPLALLFGQLMFVARLLLLGAVLAAALILHNIWRLIGLPSPWPRLFLLSVSWTFGLATATKGKRLRKNVFYAANHHSWIDIPVMSGVTGCTFVANDGIRDWPVVGWLCGMNNTIFVSRENRLSVGDQVDELRGAMAGEQPVTIFPEGTTHDGSGPIAVQTIAFCRIGAAACRDDGAARFPVLWPPYAAHCMGRRGTCHAQFLAYAFLCAPGNGDHIFSRAL